MDGLLERFLRYVRIDTQSDETSETSPSTTKQLDLSRLLAKECRELGLDDVSCDEHGIVMATVPATVSHDAPTIVWNSHVDTSPEYSGTNVSPIVHENYPGGDIPLPKGDSLVLRVADNPALENLVGTTIITTDGTTLLGGDDKAGIAVIMTTAARLMLNRDIPHGPVRLCFTVDEEIGRGIENLDFEKLGGMCGYTLDSSGVGVVDCETFSADLAIVTVRGVNSHPSEGKTKGMVNSIRILSRFITELPTDELSPETTEGREGFLHPYVIEGGVAEASARIILRNFETARLGEYAALLDSIAERLRTEHPRATIDVAVRKQYRNMRDGLEREPRAVEKAVAAVWAAGLEPKLDIIRGGTDGALMTERGLPCPNLSCGQHNPHSPLEWASLKEMEQSVDVLVELAKEWGREKE
ncbi:MAG: peptidase T [Planctomycetota bacterium]|nr:MAG: peptidase T [Planctomycetota bacterium]REK39899.1 MAG: peptidase T [Planctomycetota bacterium]